MGCGASKEENAGKVRNDEIDNQLKRDKMAQRSEIKMLLLGKMKCCNHLQNMLISYRCWRIWKIYHPETNEAHP